MNYSYTIAIVLKYTFNNKYTIVCIYIYIYIYVCVYDCVNIELLATNSKEQTSRYAVSSRRNRRLTSRDRVPYNSCLSDKRDHPTRSGRNDRNIRRTLLPRESLRDVMVAVNKNKKTNDIVI